jgi:hypothetical protein
LNKITTVIADTTSFESFELFWALDFNLSICKVMLGFRVELTLSMNLIIIYKYTFVSTGLLHVVLSIKQVMEWSYTYNPNYPITFISKEICDKIGNCDQAGYKATC